MSEAWKQWEGRLVDGKFQLRQYLGGSDHSAVFLTERGEPAQRAAIKFIQVDAGAAELQLSRWRRAARLSHPNLLQIFECGRCRIADFNLLYVVMECANENLGEFLPQRPLTPAEAREVLAPALQALSYLHREGLVHGHIQPSNVLALEDQLKLSTDSVSPAPVVKPEEGKEIYKIPAGTIEGELLEAGAAGESATLRRPSLYCAPEAVKGTAVTPQGDVWSLGITVVEMLTQRPPAVGTTARPDPVLPETLPAAFLEIVRSCLKRDPQARWTAEQIADFLNSGAAPAASVAASPAAAASAPATSAPATPARPAVRVALPAPVTLVGIPVAPPPASTTAAMNAAAAAPARVPPPAPSKSEPYHIPAPRPPIQSYSAARADAKQRHDTGLPGLPKLKQPPLMPKINYFIFGVVLGLLFIGVLGIKLFSRRTPVQQQAAATPQQPAPSVPDTSTTASPGRGKAKPKSVQKTPVTPPANSGSPAAQRTSQPPAQTAVKSAIDKQQPVTSVSSKQPAVAPSPAASPHTDSLSAATVPADVAGSSAAGAVVHGEVLNQVLPEVSDKARSTIWGTVRVAVKVHVDSAGNVTGAELNSPGPSKFFADKALEAAKSWDFAPAKVDGHNVAADWIIRFHFTHSDTRVYPEEATP